MRILMSVAYAIGALLGVTLTLIAPHPGRHARLAPEAEAAAHLAAITPETPAPAPPRAVPGACPIPVEASRRTVPVVEPPPQDLLERTLAGLRALPDREVGTS